MSLSESICRLSFLLSLFVTVVYAEGLPKFEAQLIDDDVKIGYGIALEDVDGDGRRDIILADKKQFVWYRNPNPVSDQWERHVIAENLTEKDNVCVAARDIDGDGKAEIAVGAEWNPGDTVNSGAVFYLVAPEDRTQKWKAIKLHHEPVVHRMRWVKLADEKFVLVVAPLHGRGNQRGAGAGVRLLAYTKPADPSEKWKTELLDDSMHVTHNFDVGQWIGDEDSPEEIVYYGKEGAKVIQHTTDESSGWKPLLIDGVKGGGETRLGKAGKENLLYTIEPFHGDKLVAYESGATGGRTVIDPTLNQGHAVAIAELMSDSNSMPEVIYGWRGKNGQGNFGVRMAYRDADGVWQRSWIDQNGMACEDLRVADLDGDGRPDVVAAGRSTHNLKIYWNRE